MKTILKWRNYLLFYLLFILFFNLILLKFPLTDVFGYEFAAFNSLILVLFIGIYTIYFFRTHFEKYKLKFIGELIKSSLLFLLVPFSVTIINSIISGFCSFLDGILFYLIITAPSVIIGISLGLYSVQFSNRIQLVAMILLYFGILLIIAFEIYFNPQVYVFNPIIGYFPGVIYDDSITITTKLVIYRILNVLFFGLIINFSLRIKRKRSKRSIVGFSILLISVLFYLVTPELGLSTTSSSLSKNLSSSVISDHFVIHFDKRIKTEEIKMLSLNHEYYYEELKEFFQVDLSEKIHSFIFLNDDQKKELFGSRNADIAKPWLNQIYMSYDNWEHTLKHELAHCFSATFGAGILRLASGLNPMLIEGIAEAAEGKYDDNTLHYMAALAYNSGYKVDLNYLFTKIGFFSKSSTISYIYSGSFVQYLIDIYGINKFKKFYANGDFQNSYEDKLSNAVEGYYAFLSDENYKYSDNKAHYYYGRKSLFQRLCPRAISEQLEHGWKQLANFEILGAEDSFRSVLEKAQNYSALMGLVQSYEKQDSIYRAISVLKDNMSSFISTSYYYNLELFLADFLVKEDEYQEAEALYDSLSIQNPNRSLEYLSHTRKELLKNDLLKKYLNGSNYDKKYYIGKINDNSYKYWTIPVMITLSKKLNEDYQIFLKKFEKNFIVKDYASSYAAYVLSKFMLYNKDFTNSRKMAGLSLRYSGDESFKAILERHYNKTKWFYQNGNELLNTFKFISN